MTWIALFDRIALGFLGLGILALAGSLLVWV